MANIKSAEKRNRQNDTNRIRNRSYRTRMRSAIKELRDAVDSGDSDKAQQLLPGTLSLLDSTAQKKIIHAKVAARTKARLTRAVRGLSG
jgi:small subunit ribosomal protein S20